MAKKAQGRRGRSATTGRFISLRTAKRRPKTSVIERITRRGNTKKSNRRKKK